MKVIRQVLVTDAMLVSSTISEPDAAAGETTAWAGGSTYALNAMVYVAGTTHRVYKSAQAGNIGHDPTTDDGTWWIDLGGTNKWAMFDGYVSTSSNETASPLTVVLDPGGIDSLYLYGMIGSTCTITMLDAPAGTEVYSRTLDLTLPSIDDWYAYFFDEEGYVSQFTLDDLPHYVNCRLTVTIAGTGNVSCGMLLVGRQKELGDTIYGAQAGIRDYSKKVTDADSGFVKLTQGRFAKTLRLQISVPRSDIPATHQMLERMRATPCVWVGSNDNTDETLNVYGFYKDFYVTVDRTNTSLYNLEIEGMV